MCCPFLSFVQQELLYPQILLLVQSGQLQGQAADAVTQLLSKLIKGGYTSFQFGPMLDSVLSLCVPGKTTKQHFVSVGRCVSAIVLHAPNANDATTTVNR